MHLFMIKLGGTPKGRLIEQHDIFFGVGNALEDFVPMIDDYWPELAGAWHIDAYRKVSLVYPYKICWRAGDLNDLSHDSKADTDADKLFFINLGGYLPDYFEEFHHKLLIIAKNQAEAIKLAKSSDFYQKFSFEATDGVQPCSHIDDKMQVDEVYCVSDLLGQSGYLHIEKLQADETFAEDVQHIGYLSRKKLIGSG